MGGPYRPMGARCWSMRASGTGTGSTRGALHTSLTRSGMPLSRVYASERKLDVEHMAVTQWQCGHCVTSQVEMAR